VEVTDKFSECRTDVSNLPDTHVQPAGVRDVSIRHDEELILSNRNIIACYIASINVRKMESTC
jgi:hypothetical protein